MESALESSRSTAAPLGFTVGFLFFVFVFAFSLVTKHVVYSFEDRARWDLLAQAFSFIGYVLPLAGGLEMLRTTVGPARTGAKLAVAATSVLFAATAAAAVLHVAFTSNATPYPMDPWNDLWKAISWISITSWHALTAAVVIIAWRSPRARTLALLAIPCSLLAHPYAFLSELMPNRVVFQVAAGAQMLFLWMALRASVPVPLDGWSRTGKALALLGKAMSLRLVFAAIAFALSAVYVATAGSPDIDEAPIRHSSSELLFTMRVLAGPAAIAIAVPLAIIGALSISRRRLHAAALLWSVILAVRVVQLLTSYFAFSKGSVLTAMLPVLMPVMETAALALVVLTCRRLAEQLASPEVIKKAAITWLVLVMAQGFSVLVPIIAVSAVGLEALFQQNGAPTFAVLVASALPMVTMFFINRLCRALTQEIDLGGARPRELPMAVVTR